MFTYLNDTLIIKSKKEEEEEEFAMLIAYKNIGK